MPGGRPVANGYDGKLAPTHNCAAMQELANKLFGSGEYDLSRVHTPERRNDALERAFFHESVRRLLSAETRGDFEREKRVIAAALAVARVERNGSSKA